MLAELRARAAGGGKTAEELAAEVLRCCLAQRTLERFKRAGELRRGGMGDADVEQTVERAIGEVRQH